MKTDIDPRVRPTQPDEAYYRNRGDQTRRWGALLLVVGVIWLVFELTSRGSLFGWSLGFVERQAELPARSFAVKQVIIRGLSDNIRLRSADSGEVLVTGVEHGFGWNSGAATSALDHIDVALDQRGDTLSVEVVRQGGLIGFIGRSPYVDLQIGLPPGTMLDIQTASGDLQADNIRADGSLTTISGEIETTDTAGALKVNSTSGDINMQDHAGSLEVNSTSGEVTLEGAIEQPHVTTVSGDIQLKGVTGDVQLETISGEIDVSDAQDVQAQLESTSGDVSLQGSLTGESRIANISGEVHLRLSDVRDLRLDASTTSGSIESNLPLTNEERDRRSLRGIVGEGASLLTIATTSGDIAVEADSR